MTDTRGIQVENSDGKTYNLDLDDNTIDYGAYDMLAALHEDAIDSIIIRYHDGSWECYSESIDVNDIEYEDDLIQDFVDSATDTINSFFTLIRSRMNL